MRETPEIKKWKLTEIEKSQLKKLMEAHQIPSGFPLCINPELGTVGIDDECRG